ncbi:hypothetical protein ABH935_007332 [Catenulispora sp. GAS73]
MDPASAANPFPRSHRRGSATEACGALALGLCDAIDAHPWVGAQLTREAVASPLLADANLFTHTRIFARSAAWLPQWSAGGCQMYAAAAPPSICSNTSECAAPVPRQTRASRVGGVLPFAGSNPM